MKKILAVLLLSMTIILPACNEQNDEPFKYLGKNYSELGYDYFIKNGAQITLSGMGFYNDNLEYYRTDTKRFPNTKEIYIAVEEETIVASLSTLDDEPVKDFLKKEYRYFKNKEYKIEMHGGAVTLFWNEGEKTFFIFCSIDDPLGKYNMSKSKAFMYGEYRNDLFKYNFGTDGRKYPNIITGFFSSTPYNLEDFDYNGYMEVKENLYEIFSHIEGKGNFLFNLEEPYDVLYTTSLAEENFQKVIYEINDISSICESELENFLAYNEMSMNDITYIEKTQLFNNDEKYYCYRFKNYDSCLYICERSPYSIYIGKPYSNVDLVWENGEPVTVAQKRKEELSEEILDMSVEEQYDIIFEEKFGMYYDEWRDLGELQLDCQELIYLSDFYNQFYQYKYVDNQGYVYVNMTELDGTESKWVWAKVSQGIIYID